jgi:hypothetical protein
MTTVTVRAGFALLGALVTVLALYPILKATRRDQQWGLLLSPEEVKATCGKPQSDDIFTLTYVEPDRRVELQFFGASHRMFLSHVKWHSSQGSGDIYQVTGKEISDAVAKGHLPACVGLAAQ